MELAPTPPSSKFQLPNHTILLQRRLSITHTILLQRRLSITPFLKSHLQSPINQTPPNSLKNNFAVRDEKKLLKNHIPTMEEILESSKSQKLDIKLQTLGPLFRVTAKSVETEYELGRAEGIIRVWLGGKKILHLDTIRLRRETLGMQRSIFGIGLFIGAVAVRYGYDSRCTTAELLAINDSDVYHSKLVRFYTRIGFKAVHEVTGSTMGDLAHMLVWGGVGTRMDADVEELLKKWGKKFRITE